MRSSSWRPSAARIGRLACPLLLLAFFYACSPEGPVPPKGEDSRKSAAVPVVVGRAEIGSMPVQLQAIGTVQALANVAVKSQAEGELMGVHFREGQEVKAGDRLFTIDPRIYQAQLHQAEALLARDRAQLENARRLAARYGAVAGRGFVAEEEVDSALSAVAALEASLKADEAAIESARLRLGFCDIRAPISGVVGGLKLHRGNLVKANDNDNPLVTILQIQPLHVAFALPERHLSDIRRFMAKGPLPVSAGLPGQEADAVQGELAFIENAVDISTGSIPLRAVFPNTDRRLWPGQFVNVTLTLSEEKEAVVVPVQAVQNGQQGPYIYVLQDDQTVAYRPVEAGRSRDGLMVIGAGVAAGEQVILEGHLRLAAGSRVKAVSGGKSP